MGTTQLFVLILLGVISLSSADTYSVKISTDQHVNVVDSRFLSFTIDPKYLFSSSEKYHSKECICMASSLTPAYLRIAGPSTAHMTFHNKTISINEIEHNDINQDAFDSPKKVALNLHGRSLEVTHSQWKRFVYWAKSTGFDLVFALNNEEKTVTGMWDPNTALRILTVAEKAKVGNIFWELGYECNNQSIEEYLNDLETLRYIIETFPPGRTEEWKVVGGDVTKCLQADSKSDFKDYLTLSNDIMDALLLNGNSTSYEIDRMSEYDRMKILRMFARSETPLWLTEAHQRRYNDMERAADWLASLGYSAKNGFAVHYRELEEEELYEPTLSFYMALLFKNLVGERVLNVNMEPQQAILFAHCTSLRHKRIPGAVTLFGANMDDEPARFSLKLSQREEGGDIMQFILGNDHNGNIVVNGRSMFYEGDLNPMVKRVSPYRTLLINLPPKSFGFWVLANTKIEACHDIEKGNKTFVEAETVNKESLRSKRSVNDDLGDAHVADLSFDFEDLADTYVTVNEALKSRINDMNEDLKKIKGIFQRNQNSGRVKRNDEESSIVSSKWRKPSLKDKIDRKLHRTFNPRGLLDDLIKRARESVDSLKHLRPHKFRWDKNRLIKRNSLNPRIRSFRPRKYDRVAKYVKNKPKHLHKITEDDTNVKRGTKNKYEKDVAKNSVETAKNDKTNPSRQVKSGELKAKSEENSNVDTVVRKRRSTDEDVQEISAENDVNLDDKATLLKLLNRLKAEINQDSKETSNENESSEGIVLKTELSDDTATIQVKDSNHKVIKTTMNKLIDVLEDFNNNLSKVWDAVSLLD
ncbi:unnamed protein product [Chrysodeixis includens]|uniref:Heparanase n=1 Tax=Chrysodeixis includens TaxID=689277 RepID=A0A9P0BZR4_CHRIL|nr:unnamed protein product [Chrysodeixis includens]